MTCLGFVIRASCFFLFFIKSVATAFSFKSFAFEEPTFGFSSRVSSLVLYCIMGLGRFHDGARQLVYKATIIVIIFAFKKCVQ